MNTTFTSVRGDQNSMQALTWKSAGGNSLLKMLAYYYIQELMANIIHDMKMLLYTDFKWFNYSSIASKLQSEKKIKCVRYELVICTRFGQKAVFAFFIKIGCKYY